MLIKKKEQQIALSELLPATTQILYLNQVVLNQKNNKIGDFPMCYSEIRCDLKKKRFFLCFKIK